MAEPYAALARAYDALMYDVSYDDWAAYLRGLLQKADCPKGGRVLEYACGTGSITRGLLAAGYEVVALDRSEEMLGLAGQKLRGIANKPKLVCADMTTFRLAKPADAAVCACDGVNYLLGERSLSRFLESAHANVKPGGVLLFDVSSPYKLREVLGDEFFFDDGEEQTLFWQNRYDASDRTVTMEITLFLREESGAYTRHDERHVQRAWQVDEIENALRAAGFAQIRAYGFGTEEPPGKKDLRIQILANRMD